MPRTPKSTELVGLPRRSALRNEGDAPLVTPAGVAIPPARMPMLFASRMLKRWRYVGVWSASLSLSVTIVRVGAAYQAWWAVWDHERLWEHTYMWPGPVDLGDGKVVVRDRDVVIELGLEKISSFQVVTFDDRAYTWTGKELVRAMGSVRIRGREHRVEAIGMVDDSAGYHPRHTHYKWAAGAGTDIRGRSVAWNLVVGINDLVPTSEQTVWVDGEVREVGPVQIADDLSLITSGDGERLEFHSEAMRQKSTNLLLIRSMYSQPYGSFSGVLPGGIELLEGYGVMEDHVAVW